MMIYIKVFRVILSCDPLACLATGVKRVPIVKHENQPPPIVFLSSPPLSTSSLTHSLPPLLRPRVLPVSPFALHSVPPSTPHHRPSLSPAARMSAPSSLPSTFSARFSSQNSGPPVPASGLSMARNRRGHSTHPSSPAGPSLPRQPRQDESPACSSCTDPGDAGTSSACETLLNPNQLRGRTVDTRGTVRQVFRDPPARNR